jgi:enterochelin esterase family protein
VESIEGDDRNVLVTFVWIGSDLPVTLRSQLFAGRVSRKLTRVEGTDVWYTSGVIRSDMSTIYQYVVDDPLEGFDFSRAREDYEKSMRLFAEAARRSFADPFNPDRQFPTAALFGGEGQAPPREQWMSVLTLPGAEPVSWWVRSSAPRGTVESHTFRSTALDNERTVSAYTPPAYSHGTTSLPVLVLLDGVAWLEVESVPAMLDNLIAAGAIPPVVAAFVHNPGTFSRMVEMACHSPMTVMLAEELLPWLAERYRIRRDASGTILGGASYGGLASCFAAFERPDVFGNVLSLSGSHWWGKAMVDANGYRFGRDDESAWLTRQFAAAERKPIRFWVDVGVLEDKPAGADGEISQIQANRFFRTVLLAKGYDVAYLEAPGGHDPANWRRTLPKGLVYLLGGTGS